MSNDVPLLSAGDAQVVTVMYGMFQFPDSVERIEDAIAAIRDGRAVVVPAAELAALRESLRMARQWIVFGAAPIGWNVDRIDAALAANGATE